MERSLLTSQGRSSPLHMFLLSFGFLLSCITASSTTIGATTDEAIHQQQWMKHQLSESLPRNVSLRLFGTIGFLPHSRTSGTILLLSQDLLKKYTCQLPSFCLIISHEDHSSKKTITVPGVHKHCVELVL